MGKLRALWLNTLDSLWFVPTLLTLAGAGLAMLLLRFDGQLLQDVDAGTRWWLFGGTADGAQGVLSAIAGSIITVTGVVFSVTIVALQLASSQFTPRVLRQFTADRANQIVLGVFIGTFTYALLVQRTIRAESDDLERYVPSVAVTGAVLLALVSIGFLIFFVNHAARSIQASVIIDAVTRDTLKVIREVFPEPFTPDDEATQAHGSAMAGSLDRGLEQESGEEVCRVDADKAGYVQAVDTNELVKYAAANGVVIRTEADAGEYVLPGQHILSVVGRGARSVDDKGMSKLRGAVVRGMERTPHQDVRFGVVELMDIAVKAMSPGINDPTTALNAVDRLSEILLELAHRQDGDHVLCDDDGEPRVLVRRARFVDVVDLAFNQTRHYAAGNPSVAIRIMQSLAHCAELAPPERRAVLVRHINAVRDTAVLRIEQREDVQRMENVFQAALRQVTSADIVAARDIGSATL